MTKQITLHLPGELHEKLKQTAEHNRRSLHSEVLWRLEQPDEPERYEEIPEIEAMILQDRAIDRDLFLQAAEAELADFPRTIREQNQRLRALLQTAITLISRTGQVNGS